MKKKRIEKEQRLLHEKEFGKKFRVMFHDWKCVYCTELKCDDGEAVEGLCVYNERKIYVDVACDNLGATIIHELAHAILWEFGIELEDKLEESFVKAIENLVAVNFKIKSSKL